MVFVHNGLVDGPIQQVIDRVAEPARENHDQVRILTSEDELREVCRSSLRGVSTCIAAAVFHSSPTEGPYGAWNYSIRMDAALGAGIEVDKHDNEQEIYLLPFQHAIDWAIAQVNTSTSQRALPSEVCIHDSSIVCSS